MDYRADHAEHKFPGAPSTSLDCHLAPLLSDLLPAENGESEFDMMMMCQVC
jgi:hypothetical protein